MKTPFPWFGGKSKVAPDVWAALGDVDNYVEPFAGSLAVLLERPAWHTGATETVNDKDQYLANFWRALSRDPDEVARYADWPSNEADLFARHMWLVNEGQRQMAAGLDADPDWYDAKIAGWWVWGICQWIGSGWCAGNGPWMVQGGEAVKVTGSNGVWRQLPHLGDAGQGVNRVSARRYVSGDGLMPRNEALYGYLAELAARLRSVRVVCGDWTRVVTPGALNHGATVGVFLDPPYSAEAGRDGSLYATDDLSVAHDVRAWCLANGDNPRYRIVLAGYEDEHAAHMPPTWRMQAWKAHTAYNTRNNAENGGVNQANRHKERLWFSPHCARIMPGLFDMSREAV